MKGVTIVPVMSVAAKALSPIDTSEAACERSRPAMLVFWKAERAIVSTLAGITSVPVMSV